MVKMRKQQAFLRFQYFEIRVDGQARYIEYFAGLHLKIPYRHFQFLKVFRRRVLPKFRLLFYSCTNASSVDLRRSNLHVSRIYFSTFLLKWYSIHLLYFLQNKFSNELHSHTLCEKFELGNLPFSVEFQ